MGAIEEFRPISRHRTAIKRTDFSRPVRLALEHGLISESTTVFDYGCGHGGDVVRLREMGVTAEGWDPVYRPSTSSNESDVVNLGYVVNVIESGVERAAALRAAWNLARKLLIVSARLNIEASTVRHQSEYGDGFVTSRSTFQKLYDQNELREWINGELGVTSVPAAPGVFYVFREELAQQSFVASRYRRVVTVPRAERPYSALEKHRELLDALAAFFAERGRLPADTESDLPAAIRHKIGSLKRAFNLIRRATGDEQWTRISEHRSQDLLIYLALGRIGGRPRFSELPESIRLDVRAFFSTYSVACRAADELLFSAGNRDLIQQACRTSSIGKLTPDALYVHVSALQHLPPVLRVYEGCARTYVGAVDAANIIKLHRHKPRISYMQYPEFEKDPHPALAASLKVPLDTFHIDYRDYSNSANPFILHRKETMLAPEHPLRTKFARLTNREDRLGLYERPETIGTWEGWQRILDEKGISYAGHQIVRRKLSAETSSE
jgi:DNA phosphorothioation-associated putative methyltransferase